MWQLGGLYELMSTARIVAAYGLESGSESEKKVFK